MDKFNNLAVLAANALVVSPGYEKIIPSNFTEYHFEKITVGFLEGKGSENVLNLYIQGQESGCYKIQSEFLCFEIE